MVDVLTDEEWKTIGIDADGHLIPFPEDQVDRLVASLALHRPPRLFTLCGVRRDEAGAARDVAVLGWGIAMGDEEDDEEDTSQHNPLLPTTSHRRPVRQTRPVRFPGQRKSPLRPQRSRRPSLLARVASQRAQRQTAATNRPLPPNKPAATEQTQPRTEPAVA